MKIANLKVEKMKNNAKFYCQLEWLFGLLVIIGGLFFNALALFLGNMLLIASTACLTIVFNAVLSPLLLKEKFKCFPDGVTVLLLSFGSTFAGTQVPKEGPVFTEEVIWSKLLSPKAFAYLSIVLLLCVIRVVYIRIMRRSL